MVRPCCIMRWGTAVGHHLIGAFPTSRRWRNVVALISGSADVEAIAAATSAAAEHSMIDASDDPAFKVSLWLLTQIPLAARDEDFTSALRRLGLRVPDNPTLVDICTGMIQAVDEAVIEHRRNDASEMALLSAVESLNAIASKEIGSLLGPSDDPAEAQEALGRLATVSAFGVLARDFFYRLTRRYLEYFLSRELGNHVGANCRFHTIRQHRDFEDALDRHCYESAIVIREFAGRWFSKANYEGGIDPQKAGRFAHHAFEKLREELRVRLGALA